MEDPEPGKMVNMWGPA